MLNPRTLASSWTSNRQHLQNIHFKQSCMLAYINKFDSINHDALIELISNKIDEVI